MRNGRGLRLRRFFYFVVFFTLAFLELACTAKATTPAESSSRPHQRHDDEAHVSTTIPTKETLSSSPSDSTVCEHVIDASSSSVSTTSSSVCHNHAVAASTPFNSNDTHPSHNRQTRNEATAHTPHSSSTTTVKPVPRIPPSCQLVMAESSLPNAGWGMYTLTHRYRGDAILPGDSIVQVVDLNDTTARGMRLLLHDYAWDAHETGGIYEALRVISLAPGIGSLANGHVARYNVLPNLPTVDEAGLTRDESPGAGAVSHYYNYTFHVQTPVLRVGEELLLNYGVNWFQERQAKLTPTLQEQQQQQQQQTKVHSSQAPSSSPTTTPSSSNKPPTLSILQQQAPPQRSKDWLMEHGLCLDNLRPGASTIPHAGRGAFTTRALPQGSIVAPIPVLPILKQSLQITRLRTKTSKDSRHEKSQPNANKDNSNNDSDDDEEEVVHLQQLLLNYCYGHANSNLLLYPYAPIVNFINHASASATTTSTTAPTKRRSQPNVRLEWAGPDTFHRNADYLNMTIPQLLQQNYSGLLLQLVATRDLRRGEEVLLDYGDDWQAAWDRHVTTTWRPNVDHYTPSYVMDDVVRNLRTVQEQRVQQPYPSNIFTSCYYRYSDHKEQAEEQYRQEQEETTTSSPAPKHQVTTFRWNATRDLLLDMRYLRPCEVLAREHVAIGASAKPATVYTVRMRNRFGLSATERIPTRLMHIVTHVPRFAIRFSDKLYTTDQHLEQAFRHAIGIPSMLYPTQWNDVESRA